MQINQVAAVQKACTCVTLPSCSVAHNRAWKGLARIMSDKFNRWCAVCCHSMCNVHQRRRASSNQRLLLHCALSVLIKTKKGKVDDTDELVATPGTSTILSSYFLIIYSANIGSGQKKMTESLAQGQVRVGRSRFCLLPTAPASAERKDIFKQNLPRGMMFTRVESAFSSSSSH